mmetsp:Transcript_25815/g.51776  ORF Transcript_25815/g.51776 Transcript_25815/m.51776 type:complete len:219 (-) Transcript_25815:596-1252(-)
MKPAENSMGTTLVVVEYNEGVIVATDSQTTSGYLITNRVADKITELSNFAVCCRSGSAADTQVIANQLKNEIKELSIQSKKKLNIRTMVQLLRNFCYLKGKKFNFGFICAGWDKFHGGQVYSVLQGGTILKNKMALSGSGSLVINGFCEENFKEKMNRKECKIFLGRAISLAILHDGGSGGVIRLCDISKTGIKRSIFFPRYRREDRIFLKTPFHVFV